MCDRIGVWKTPENYYLCAIYVKTKNNLYTMKKFFFRLAFVASLLAMVTLTGCDETKKNKGFSLSVKEAGPEYVEVLVQGGELIRMAYMVDEREMRMENPQQIFKKGTELNIAGGQTFRVSLGLKENTQYYLYACAALTETEFSEIITLPFTTTNYNLSELLTVVDQYYDGYKMRLTLPKETKDRKNAIRYNQSCIMMYNYMKGSNDDYFSCLYNAGKYATDDTTLVYSEETNWYQTDSDSDGDGEIDWDTMYNPISPGEPIVFVAGEFSWMEDTPEYENDYFFFPSGWDPGYYMPLIDPAYYTSGKSQSSMGIIDWNYTHPLDNYWTGAFQRKHFRIKEPAPLEAKVEVKLAKVTPVNATLEFWPEEGVNQYAFGIFDDATYQNQVLPLLNNNPDYMQWAVTSYFAAYTFGTKVTSGAAQADLTSFYYQNAITPETKYHVFVTAMGDPAGTTQSFNTFTFETTKKVLPEPVIEVTPVMEKSTPFKAVFNIKCTTYQNNPLMEASYAANYVRDWKLATNGGSTYFSILNSQIQYGIVFSAAELSAINSEEGYEIAFPSVDGETTRLAVLGYNTEYTPNDVSSFQDITECPAVADLTTPWTAKKDPVDPIHYEDLIGTWTATATLQDGSNTNRVYEHKSKITISDNAYDYPSSIGKDVYDLYKKTANKDKEEVDALWTQFKQYAEVFTVNRLMNQNRLLCLGWLDDDTYDRLTARSPYDLFIATDYSSVDVSSIYNDFGPKWYIEAVEDPATGEVSLIAPVDANFLPPTSNWSVPFYMSGMEPKNYYTVTYAQDGNLHFPVEYDRENDEITIRPFEHNGVEYYPNIVGIDATSGGTILENPVVSEVVLTRGWTEPEKEQSALRSKGNVNAVGEFPTTVYKQRTQLKAAPELKTIEVEPVTPEQFKERADKLVERFVNQSR